MNVKIIKIIRLKCIFFLVLFSCSLLFSNGSFSVETISQEDGLRDGPDYSEALVYYPLEASNYLPVVILVPGFTNSLSDIENWGYYLASYGFVTLLVNVNSIFQPPDYRSAALLDGIVTMREENGRLDSPLFENLNIEDFAVGGYSMGGGGAQLAAQQDSSIKAVIALSPWLDNPDITLNNSTSILFISGEFDNVASNDYHTNVFYDNTSDTTDKMLYEISGGDHYTVASPYSDQEMGLKIVFWLEKYILSNLSNCDSLIIQPATASDFSTNIECPSIFIGDITEDGNVNILDLLLLVSWLINGNVLSESEVSLADITNDGVLGIFDIIMLIDIIQSR